MNVVARGPVKIALSAPDYVRLSTEPKLPLRHNVLHLDLPPGKHEVRVLATKVKDNAPELVLVYRIEVKAR